MNTLANSPVTGHVPAVSVKPVIATVTDIAAAVVPKPRAAAWRKAMDTLVTIYAYGLLGFGLFFPWLLAAWYAVFGSAAH